METKKKHHNLQVAKNRGEEWRKNLIKGKHESSMNPTKLKLARVKAGMSHDVVAKEIKTSPNTFGSIERGKRAVSKERAEAIAEVFGRKLNYFFKKAEKTEKKYVARNP